MFTYRQVVNVNGSLLEIYIVTRLFFIFTIFISLVFGFISSSFQVDTNTDSFLKKPFDLQKFKKARGQSNSGGATRMPYYYKPETKGMYYHFFLFNCLCGYIGETPNENIHLENGLNIITYKPFGKYKDSYFDPTEILIEVVARFNDKHLPELAFVGLDTVKIKKKLGDDFFRKSNCFIYSKDKRVLVLKIKAGRVECLKWSRLKTSINANNIPKELLMGV